MKPNSVCVPSNQVSAVLLFFFTCLPLLGTQPGELDHGFVPGITSGSPSRCVAVQADGRILVGGGSYTYSGLTLSRGAVVRLSPNGSLEPSFSPPFDGVCYSITELPDGSIIAGGGFRSFESDVPQGIFRLTRDGRLHPDFKLADTSEAEVFVVTPQQDGRLLIGGRFSKVGGLSRPNIARLKIDGSVDPTFNPGAGVVALLANGGITFVFSMELDDQERVLVAGIFELADGRPSPGVARFLPDGRIDETFSSPLRFDCNVRAARRQPGGKILLGGAIQLSTNSTALIRLLADGSVDPTFVDRSGLTSSADVNQLQVDPEGRILVASKMASSGGGSGYLVRLLPDGTLDAAFSGRYTNLTDGIVRDVALQSDGRIVVVGDFTSAQSAERRGVARLQGGSGSPLPPSIGLPPRVVTMFLGGSTTLDARPLGNPRPEVLWFHNGVPLPGATNPLLTLRHLSSAGLGDYSIRVANAEGAITGLVATVCALAPLVEIGAADLSFSPPPITSIVNSLLEQSDCRILVGTIFGIRRLSRAGEEDFSFARDARAFVTRQMILDAHGNILAVGSPGAGAGPTRDGLARFTSEGVLDMSTGPSAEFTGVGTALATDVRGRIYVARLEPSSKLSSLTRFLNSGGLDPEFLPITNVPGTFSVLLPQIDGGIIVGGAFSEIRGQTQSNLVRFTETGELDPSFVGSADGEILSVAARSDGKILFGGAFSKFAGAASPRLALVDRDGVLDPGFRSGSVPFPVKHIVVEPSGSILTCNLLSISQSAGGSPPLSWLAANGELLEGIGTGGSFQGRGVNVGLLSTCGKLLLGGQFTSIGGAHTLNLARIHLDPLPHFPPRMLSEPRSVFQAYGEKVVLGVAASGQPLAFQWYRDGQPVKGAIQSYFTDAAWDPEKPRRYTVTVSNALGFLTSGEAVVTSLWDLPKIALHPRDQTVAEGQAVLLSAAANGNPQPVFQWLRNGVAILGETNTTLLLPEVHPEDTGGFGFVASSPGGAVTSALARVSIAPTVDLNHALNTTNWVWISPANRGSARLASDSGGGTGSVRCLRRRSGSPLLSMDEERSRAARGDASRLQNCRRFSHGPWSVFRSCRKRFWTDRERGGGAPDRGGTTAIAVTTLGAGDCFSIRSRGGCRRELSSGVFRGSDHMEPSA